MLTTDRRVLAVAAEHPLASRRIVSVEDLADQTIALMPSLPKEITDAFTPQVTPSGRPIATRTVTNATEVMTLVARGEVVHATVASLPDYLPYPGIAYVPIGDLPPSSAGLVWRTDAEAPAVRAFADAVREVIGDPLGSSLR